MTLPTCHLARGLPCQNIGYRGKLTSVTAKEAACSASPSQCAMLRPGRFWKAKKGWHRGLPAGLLRVFNRGAGGSKPPQNPSQTIPCVGALAFKVNRTVCLKSAPMGCIEKYGFILRAYFEQRNNQTGLVCQFRTAINCITGNQSATIGPLCSKSWHVEEADSFLDVLITDHFTDIGW